MEFLASLKFYRHLLTYAVLATTLLTTTLPQRLHAASRNALSIGWGEWAPYTYTDEHGKLTGLEVEIAEAVFGKAGYQLEWKKLPWKRHLLMLEKGEIDIASAASWNEERAKICLLFSTVSTGTNCTVTQRRNRSQASNVPIPGGGFAVPP